MRMITMAEYLEYIHSVKDAERDVSDKNVGDLISRQAALDALNERCESECEYSKKQRSVMCTACYLGSAKEAVENLPTIDPVKHGKWTDGKYMGFDGCFIWHRECSICGYERSDDNPDKDTPYCPNCGAQMERSEDETN